MPMVNMILQIKDPQLWKVVRKHFFPTIFDKISKLFGKK